MAYTIVPNRRQFLATLAAIPAAAVAGGSETRWAWLSDTHIAKDPADVVRGFHPHDNLRKVVSQVLESAPHSALIDGDLARLRGLPGDYPQFRSLIEPLAAKMPVGLVLGNHDNRKNFLAAFGVTPAQASGALGFGKRRRIKNKYVVTLGNPPTRLILLDSLFRTDIVAGLLGKAQRTWLENYLASATPMPTLLFVHHTLDDGDSSLLDVDRLFRIIKPHRMVKAIVYGHSHAYKFDTWNGIHLVNIPAVGYNFTPTEPIGWVETRLSAAGADLTLHAIGGNMAGDGKTTSISWRA